MKLIKIARNLYFLQNHATFLVTKYFTKITISLEGNMPRINQPIKMKLTMLLWNHLVILLVSIITGWYCQDSGSLKFVEETIINWPLNYTALSIIAIALHKKPLKLGIERISFWKQVHIVCFNRLQSRKMC